MAAITVLGAGGWGIAFGIMCRKSGNSVTLWTPFDQERELLLREREHTALLEGVKIPEEIEITSELSSVSTADIVVIAVPSSAVNETAARIKGMIKENAVLICLSKGLDGTRFMLMHEVIKEQLPDCRLCVVSGPSHAEEVARDLPTAVVAASEDEEVAKYVQRQVSCDTFRIYTTTDVIGVETAGAIKNVVALVAGVLDGMGYEDNTKAALMTRGMKEISDLGVAMGGRKTTFLGLAGFGDLIVTCTSMHSRNRRAGILIGQGCSAEETLKRIGMTVEGYATTKAAYNFAREKNVEMPIVTEMYRVLYEGKDPRVALTDLLNRPMKAE
ncbi:MAG: NAD(P)-dependent glycerol-3-phosphate dehydrogenase [Clostridia bacterium]|nr:NAD(P)-dependent glycerol-3-phosphate dehydrogenase [Clostridia bacterium]